MLDFCICIGIRTSLRKWATVLLECDEVVFWDSCLSPVAFQCSIVQFSMANSDKMWTFAFPIHFLVSDNLLLHRMFATRHSLTSCSAWCGRNYSCTSTCGCCNRLAIHSKQYPQLKRCIHNQRPCTRDLVIVVYTLSVAHGARPMWSANGMTKRCAVGAS